MCEFRRWSDRSRTMANDRYGDIRGVRTTTTDKFTYDIVAALRAIKSIVSESQPP